jgi:hypothetical protein
MTRKTLQKIVSLCKDALGKPNDNVLEDDEFGKTVQLPNDMAYGWNMNFKGSRLRPNAKFISVTYPKGGYRSQHGVNIKSTKMEGFKTRGVELTYEVFVEKDWDPVKGGKLPGFIINGGTGGKDYKKNDGSVRIMWRNKGQLVAYLYPCVDQGRDFSKTMGPHMKEACKKFPPAGIDVWRYTDEKVFLKPGEWNCITIGAELNDPEQSNGKLWLIVNGTKLSVDDVCFTKRSDKNLFTGLQFSSWYGGGSSSWAPKKDQTLKFRNFAYRTFNS